MFDLVFPFCKIREGEKKGISHTEKKPLGERKKVQDIERVGILPWPLWPVI
jgi:hypothetical protein